MHALLLLVVTNTRHRFQASDTIAELAAECANLRTEIQQMGVAKARLETALSAEKDAVAAAKEKLAAATAGASQQVRAS